MRTGTSIPGGGGVRLDASGGPPAGSVFGEFAHFCATGGSLGMRATAVAAGDRGVDASGRVRPDGVGGDAEKEQKFQSKPQCPAAETAVARGAHERSVGGREGKTSSARDTKMGETGVLVRKSK